MSKLSKAIGLDKHPDVLKAINTIGSLAVAMLLPSMKDEYETGVQKVTEELKPRYDAAVKAAGVNEEAAAKLWAVVSPEAIKDPLWEAIESAV